MRILHTADWHVGRSLHGAGLLTHQQQVLQALVDVVASESVDVVVVAGDLYDRQLPSLPAVEVMDWALSELRGAGATVVAITGNHDSGPRVSFGARLLAAGGLHLRGDVRAAAQPVLVPATDGGDDLVVYPVPFLEPEVARHALGAPGARTHEQLLRHALDGARADLARRGAVRSVAVAHAFVSGGTPCDSERVLRVGGSDRVSLRALQGFDYVALGHLHGRQVLGDGRIRYAGSPLAYSFSEAGQRKGAWLVDLTTDGRVRIDSVALPCPRPLAVVRGNLEALLSRPDLRSSEDAWVQVTLTDTALPREAMQRVRRRFPNTLVLRHEPPDRAASPASYRERVRDRDDLVLMRDFVEHVSGRCCDDDERDDLRAALADALREEAA